MTSVNLLALMLPHTQKFVIVLSLLDLEFYLNFLTQIHLTIKSK